MNIDLTAMSAGQVYNTMIQTIVPRPVAWVLTENTDQSFNVAPFSYFNALSSDPPLLMLSVGKKPGGELKDTRVNIVERSDFVIHVAHQAMAEAVTESSRNLAAGESEVEHGGLELSEFENFRLPRLKACRLAFACERYRVEDITAGQAMIIGLVKHIYIDDTIVSLDANNRLEVMADKLDPLMRLGGDKYGVLGGIISVPRPK